MFDVLTCRDGEGAFLGPLLTVCCAPTNHSHSVMGLCPSHLPHAVFPYNSKTLLHSTFRKKSFLSIMQAIYLHVQPVTKPWPPRSCTDYSRPGRNNQHTRGKRRTPRPPLDQNHCTRYCYFSNIWLYLTKYIMHHSSI